MRPVLLSCCLLITAGSCVAVLPTVPPEQFAILPWGTTTDETALPGIRECGFNLAGFVYPDKLNAVQAAGLKAIVIDPSVQIEGTSHEELTSRVQALARLTANHPATYGYYLRDEPNAALFPALGAWVDAFKSAAPNAIPYINLLPNYATAGQLGTPTYPDYLEKFVQQSRPAFLSYDNYSLLLGNALRDGYFQNLEAMRTAALKHSLPFWNIVLSNSHFSYAEPTPAGLRFEAYTTMAYGARGISYFTYFAPPTGNYRLAPVDQFGHHTPTWDMLRNVNLQIHQLAPTLARLKSINVFHCPTVPHDCQGSATAKLVASISGGQFLVGEFDGGDRDYVMVVNCSLADSAALSFAFKSPGPIEMVNTYNGFIQPWTGENVWLAAGQGVLLTRKRSTAE